MDSSRSLAADLIGQHVLPKLARQAGRDEVGFPLFTEGGCWVPSHEARWSDGFWPGLYWLAWRASGEPRFRRGAEAGLSCLRPAPDDPVVNYDLGFLYAYSYALGHRLTGSDAYRKRALAAAERLCGLVCGPSGLITVHYPLREARFGQARVTTKIDVMMNLTLLWWASVESGDPHFRDVASRHSEGSLEHLLRENGSVWEMADLDPVSGVLLTCDTQEGLPGESAWARAQAWAIYGFLQAAHFSGENHFLEAARRALGFWCACLPGDAVPFWDLTARPADATPRDASAAAIVLAALVWARARSLVLPEADALIEATLSGLQDYLTPVGDDGLLNGGCAYHRKGEGRWGATVWGDFYFFEALSALAGY